MLFTPDFVASSWRHGDGPGPDLTIDVAADVETPSYVDMELDVFRYPGGRVEVEDEQEFEELVASGVISRELGVRLRSSCAELVARVTGANFDVPAERWWAVAELATSLGGGLAGRGRSRRS